MIPNFKRLEDTLDFSATNWPQNIALEDSETSLTYSQVKSLSETVSSFLSQQDLSSNSRIGILLPKSRWSLVCIFAILKAGHTYIPLDYDAPEERNVFIIKDCEIDAVLSFDNAGIKSELFIKKPIPVEESNVFIFLRENSTLAAHKFSEDLAYILYTSGSTGRPKGVVFSHSNALSFIKWCSLTFNANSQSVFSSHAPFHFDLSILDIYFPFSHGSKLILINSQLGKNPRALSHLIESKKITHWYSTPTILKLILSFGKPERFDHNSLEYVLFAGEVFPTTSLRGLSKSWSKAKFYNLYGPTETNVCTYFKIPETIPDEKKNPYPIGKICNHLDAKLVNYENDKLELCISGSAVCLGYWNNAEKNLEVFFYAEGKKWYKTGDLVSLNEQGDFVFEGRRDRMIKKNGFRIELGEIENTLNNHPLINHAAVLAIKNELEEVNVHCFIQVQESAGLKSADVRNFCNQYIPDYMLPDKIHFIEQFPTTSTDKIDYQGLKKMLSHGF